MCGRVILQFVFECVYVLEIMVRIYTVYRICTAVGNPQSARFVEDETFEHFTVSIVNVLYVCLFFSSDGKRREGIP